MSTFTSVQLTDDQYTQAVEILEEYKPDWLSIFNFEPSTVWDLSEKGAYAMGHVLTTDPLIAMSIMGEHGENVDVFIRAAIGEAWDVPRGDWSQICMGFIVRAMELWASMMVAILNSKLGLFDYE